LRAAYFTKKCPCPLPISNVKLDISGGNVDFSVSARAVTRAATRARWPGAAFRFGASKLESVVFKTGYLSI
jgi:hypothetical protein